MTRKNALHQRVPFGGPLLERSANSLFPSKLDPPARGGGSLSDALRGVDNTLSGTRGFPVCSILHFLFVWLKDIQHTCFT